jgi:DNA-directed RNA polymerase subunit RPC12/RpoP
MKSKCAECKARLERGFYIELKDFEALKEGKPVEITEVIRCPSCHRLAALWEDDLVFYQKDLAVHNERSETTEKESTK